MPNIYSIVSKERNAPLAAVMRHPFTTKGGLTQETADTPCRGIKRRSEEYIEMRMKQKIQTGYTIFTAFPMKTHPLFYKKFYRTYICIEDNYKKSKRRIM